MSPPLWERRWVTIIRRLAGIGALALAVWTLWWLWPVPLGGQTTMIVVQGHSMEPTYQNGDLIVTRRQSHYEPGDIVVFKVEQPGSSRLALVVHRLLGIDGNGHITTQGDNRERPDGFTLGTDDIVGSAGLRVPHGGTIL